MTPPTVLWSGPIACGFVIAPITIPNWNFDVSPDGQHFVMVKPVMEPESARADEVTMPVDLGAS